MTLTPPPSAPIHALIVEDEVHNQQLLRHLLENFCEKVTIIGIAGTVQEAVGLIEQHQPELVFLDIQLPQQNGFQLFDYVDNPQFEVIFTTAHADFAVKAIRLAALDYLLKPISLWELTDALKRFRKKRQQQNSNRPQPEQIKVGEEHLQNTPQPRIALPTAEGHVVIDVASIIYCEAEGSYTNFYFADGQPALLVSKNIKEYEELLEEYHFRRVHRSFLINPSHVKRVIRSKSPTLVMSDGSSVAVSRRRRAILEELAIRG